jgi:hypothetical protein
MNHTAAVQCAAPSVQASELTLVATAGNSGTGPDSLRPAAPASRSVACCTCAARHRSAFDPWTATPEEALAARDTVMPRAPDPLAQHHAAAEVLAARERCERPDGGCAVLKALSLCLANELMPPKWLRDAYAGRWQKIQDAHVATLDGAFGRPWPLRTRLATERRKLQLKKLIHAAVWQRVIAGAKVTHDLFEEVGELLGVHCSGSTAKGIYYAALREGAPNPRIMNPHLTASLDG